MLKRVFALCIVLGLMVASITATASYEVLSDGEFGIRTISDRSMFEELFASTQNRSVLTGSENPCIEYEVQISPAGDTSYNVNLDFVIHNSGDSYYANANGIVSMTMLDSGQSYIAGPLEGAIILSDNDTYDIIVGFQSELNSEDISAGVNVVTGDGNLYFAFGEYVMPDDIFDTYQSTDMETGMISDVVNSSVTSLPPGDEEYSFVGRDTSTHSDGSVIGIFDIYYSVGRGVIATTLSSNADALLQDDFFSTSRVYSADVEVSTDDLDAAIERFYYYPGEAGVGSDLGDFVADVFSDICGFLPVPIPSATIINMVRNTLSGGISATISPNERTATFNTNVNTGNYDDVPLTVAVELRGTLPGDYEYTSVSSMRYVCTQIKDIYYVDTDEMQVVDTFSVE